MILLECPNCKTKVNDNHNFCPTCCHILKKRTKFPLIAGILAAATSCLVIFSGVVLLTGAWLIFNINQHIALQDNAGPYLQFPTYFLFSGILSLVAFVIGISGGIAAINRKLIKLSILGLGLLIVTGVFLSIPFNSASSWEMGFPITVMSALGISFVWKSRCEFR